MSSLLDEVLQQALSTAPWASTPDSGHILKYTRHPSRPGYVFLLTDLSRVYIEILTAASVPSRLIEIKKEAGKRGAKGRKQSSADGSDDDEDDGDVVKSSERALKRLEGAMADLGGAYVQVEDHDYHDKVVHLEASHCAWIFQMTEIKGREALEVLASQLITPMAALLAGAHGTSVERHAAPITAVATLFTDTDIATSMVASATDGRPERRVPARQPRTAPREVTSEQDGDSAEEYKSPSPAKRSRRRSPEKKRPFSGPESAVPNSDDEDRDVQDRAAKKGNNATSRQAKQPRPDDSDKEQSGRDADSASPPAPAAPSQQSKRERDEAEEEELEKRMEQMKKKMSSGGGGGRLSKRRGGRFG